MSQLSGRAEAVAGVSALRSAQPGVSAACTAHQSSSSVRMPMVSACGPQGLALAMTWPQHERAEDLSPEVAAAWTVCTSEAAVATLIPPTQG
eukprot:CAMPEP_0115591880 /NCGR_PEP_ID=MMETSP0272-20121206/10503_1 /TAXON_ID=71861 /ORGANISM="Scrippsiella trochoidea, Strain CCMP3099" /LENGTH=91 /DNA_ID=CAMNT_0003027111 /DNA_START=292 /DNA_END=568 /DNA_ORIENTATION=+